MNPEDEKLIALAKGARARNGAEHGAAVRDDSGRSYSGADVVLPSLRVTAAQLAVAQAVAAGAQHLEAVAIVGAESLSRGDRSVIDEAGGVRAPVFLANRAGDIVDVKKA